jgi:hypothetical protein
VAFPIHITLLAAVLIMLYLLTLGQSAERTPPRNCVNRILSRGGSGRIPQMG